MSSKKQPPQTKAPLKRKALSPYLMIRRTDDGCFIISMDRPGDNGLSVGNDMQLVAVDATALLARVSDWISRPLDIRAPR